nr:NUDIX domain-containing protein [Paenisporosarcina indica]
MAVAFLFNDNQKVLFLHKKSTSTFLPGLLVPIGGHIEGEEIEDPNKACLREIEEETGLLVNHIDSLTLRYVVLRMKDKNEIRIQYVYFGNVMSESELIESDEGQLSWIESKDISQQNVTATTREIIKHYFVEGIGTDQVYVGSMKSFKGEPLITWAVLEDWEFPVITCSREKNALLKASNKES